MFRSNISTRRLALAGCALLAASTLLHAQDDNSHRGRKYKAPPPTAHFVITVVRATTGKPVENAAVIFHPLADGKDDGNMELKTDEDGKTSLDLLEIGSNVLVQIIAPGFQTFGQEYKIDKDSIAVEVKLKRPAPQYSIYKKNGESGPSAPPDDPLKDRGTDAAPKPEDPKSDASKPAAPKDAPKQQAPKDSSKPAEPAPQSN